MRLFFLLFLISLSSIFLSGTATDEYRFDKAIEVYYLKQLDTFKQNVESLKSSIRKQEDSKILKKGFKTARLSYKKLSILTDYFNPYETIQLNSPALKRTEDDNPTIIIEPHGFQKLEELLWSDETKDDSSKSLLYETTFILNVIQQLETEPDRVFKFNNAAVWNAVKSALIRLITLGITGYDSPVAMLSIEETIATLEGIEKIIDIYFPAFDRKKADRFHAIQRGIISAINYLKKDKNFDHFNRLYFTRNIIIPLCNDVSSAIAVQRYDMPEKRRALNPMAENIFSPDAFDVNFFSPTERYRPTNERILLGKKLFYDAQLSGNNTRSCASCHKPELAFTDGLPKALAMDNKTQLPRNTPSLLNAVYQTKQFYDSRQDMLEFQVNNVVHNEKEMGGSIEKTAAALQHQQDYIAAFSKAYPNDANSITIYTIANAISSYVRSLQSLNSKFDRYMRNEEVDFSEQEKKGFNLFMGKAKCGTCHFMPLFNGLVPPTFDETESEVLGVPSNATKPAIPDADSGKYYFTKSIPHLFSFKTPTVRNTALTAPYMHNGVYKTLGEVIDFYNNGGGKGLGIILENQSLPFDKLNLSKKEKKDIIAFLNTLTDTSAVTLKK